MFLFEEIANRMKEKKKETIKQLLTYNERLKLSLYPEKEKKFCINSQDIQNGNTLIITVSCTYLDLNNYST